MKTIEQHLQDLFVGKVVKITFLDTFDDALNPIYNTVIGIVSEYIIAVDENSWDAHVVEIEGYHEDLQVSPYYEGCCIEILE
jgi:hypothetical protein